MNRKLLLAFTLFGATSLSAQTADEIVSKYVEARGGVAKIKSVKSERITGVISFGPDADGPFFIERKRPLKLHMEITLNGQTLIRTYNGKSAGWLYNPFTASPTVQPFSESELRNIFDEADFDGPFVDYKQKGNAIEFVGKDEILGKAAFKIKLTSKLGDASFFYFDASTFLPLKWEGNRRLADKDIPWETFFHDFREVDGLKYPFLIESDAPGTDQTQRISADKIEINISIEDTRFGKPTPTPPADASASPAAPSDAPAEPPKPN